MNLECVIVCKDYSDFLAHTLPINMNYFDDVVVVTGYDDKETHALCDKYGVECLKTDVFFDNGDTFNKGRAINLGLQNLKKKDWLLHLDADIVLPHRFRDMLFRNKLDPKNIYGADRLNVYGYEAWEKLRPRLIPHYSGGWFVDPGFCHEKDPVEGVKLGARVIHKEHGYVPIGFFQLWHTFAGRSYNYKLGSAAGADICFPVQWPRANRILLPEVVVYHLDSELEHGIGTNWKGRKSRKFGPGEDGKLDRRHHKHHKHHHHGHHHHHYDPDPDPEPWWKKLWEEILHFFCGDEEKARALFKERGIFLKEEKK